MKSRDSAKEKDVRMGNIIAAKAVADAVRTSLGPRGMDKMIQSDTGEVIITNDGATILERMQVFHPTAKMLVGISKSQDIEAGDGTTSVVVIAGAFLEAVLMLLGKGVHPTIIADCFIKAEAKSREILRSIAIPVDLDDRDSLIQAATISLSSKIVYQNADILAPMAVDAVLKVADLSKSNVDLEDVRVVERLGGTVDDSEMVDGLVLNNSIWGKIKNIENAKVLLIQFCLSAPKTDMDNSVVVSEYQQMDRILKAERKYLLKMCKAIKKTGCNVLLIQKSILRDAYNSLSMHFLAKLGIAVVKDVERTDVPFICKTVGCQPVADMTALSPERLGHVNNVCSKSGCVVMTGCKSSAKSVSILLKSSNELMLGEAGRSLHDALCVVRSLVKERYMIHGGGGPEIELSLQLGRWADQLEGMESFCIKAFANALEVIPRTLAENAGLHPVTITTQLRKLHNDGKVTAGINVKKGIVAELKGDVIQPLLVNLSAISLASEVTRMILKIDDMVTVMR